MKHRHGPAPRKLGACRCPNLGTNRSFQVQSARDRGPSERENGDTSQLANRAQDVQSKQVHKWRKWTQKSHVRRLLAIEIVHLSPCLRVFRFLPIFKFQFQFPNSKFQIPNSTLRIPIPVPQDSNPRNPAKFVVTLTSFSRRSRAAR